MSSAPSPPSSLVIAPFKPVIVLLLKQRITIDTKLLFETLVHRYTKPDGTAPLVSVRGKSEIGALVSFSGIDIFVGIRDQVLETPGLDWAAPEITRWHWPDAQSVCRDHRAQVIVAAEAPHRHPPTLAKVMAAVAGAIAYLYPTEVLGGLWDWNVVSSREMWVRDSALMFRPFPEYPINLWVSHLLYRDRLRTDGVVVVSHGLARFMGREAEVAGPSAHAAKLSECCVGLTQYLLHYGNVVKTGDTIGRYEQERVRVMLRLSDRFPNLAVVAAMI
jgi:hypothetical protein